MRRLYLPQVGVISRRLIQQQPQCIPGSKLVLFAELLEVPLVLWGQPEVHLDIFLWLFMKNTGLFWL